MRVLPSQRLKFLGATLALTCLVACGDESPASDLSMDEQQALSQALNCHLASGGEVIRDPDRAVASSTTTDGEVIRDPDRVAMASSLKTRWYGTESRNQGRIQRLDSRSAVACGSKFIQRTQQLSNDLIIED